MAEGDQATAPTPADDLGGSYEVIRRRLLERAEELGRKAEQLNARRKEVFGGSEMALAATERVRTENNCLPRDMVSVGSRLLVGYDVFVGMKSEITVPDIFGLYRFERSESGALTLEPTPLEESGFLADERFVKEFGELFRYVRETRLGQLRRTDRRLLAVFSTGQGARDHKVFRWGIDAAGKIAYVDSRGEEDHVRPKAHDFTWKSAGRDDHVHGRHPHVSIYDELFVETIGGDLTIKVENNTTTGQGIFSEPVDDANQSLDDASIAYARLGPLIFLRIKPYREEVTRYFLYNSRRRQVQRIDALAEACLALPEDQGVIFPSGYYLATGESKRFDADGGPMAFERVVRAPNGEDVLYVFFRAADGKYLLYPYNLIRKEVASPIACHGYSLFDDGTLIVFRASPDEEPTRIHPMQVWRTPFTSAEYAASAPTTGSFLSKIGNPDLVRGISDALSLRRTALGEAPSRQTWEDLIAAARRMLDAYHWLGHAECFELLPTVKELCAVSEQIIDEYEKVEAIRRRAAESLAQAEATQKELLRRRPEDDNAASAYMETLTALQRQRGVLGTLRELRYMDLARVGALEAEVDARFAEVSRAAAVFLAGADALRPLLEAIATAVKKAEAAARTVELAPVVKEVDVVHEGLTVLSETVAGLEVDDPTVRTRILDAIGEVFSQLNRARAIVQQRAKELRGAEGRAEFGAQARLFAQGVQSALAVVDTPERCDQSLSRLLVQLEELEGRFGELDEFAADLAARREELNDAFGAKRQTLLDERQRRASNLLAAAERILQGVQRRARTFTTPEELNGFFAGDPMVAKVRDLVEQLRGLGDTVKGDEVDGKLKAARQDGLRTLRDRSELFEGADNVIKFGRHRFFVNTQSLELTIVPRDGGLAIHLTGTDFFEAIDDPTLTASRDLWEQNLPSECPTVYRGEFLAYSLLRAAERGEGGRSVDKLRQEALVDGGLLAAVRLWAAERHDEGYERGVHDVDATHILDRVLALLHTAGTLRHESAARALGVLYFAGLDTPARELLGRRARSATRLWTITGHGAARDELVTELQTALAQTVRDWRLPPDAGELRRAARYLADELAADRPAFVLAGEAAALHGDFVKRLAEEGARTSFEDDLRALEKHPAERLSLVTRWLEGFVARDPHAQSRTPFVREVAVAMVTDRKVDRAPGAAVLEVRVEGLLGQHALVHERALTLRVDEFLARLESYTEERLPRWRAYRKARTEVAERERRRLRLDEFAPKVLSSFVRNKLVNEVYLPLVGANLAKQLGAAGDAKRTDLMGLLLLVSPPGYGKTTLMEYVASRLGLVFVKVNGPALGHDVVSIDPAEAPNATARQEVEKINLGLEMGNNVMLYLDDIQHTNPELLQKFISLCDGSRRIEGVWKGRTRTYDLRGKRFCIVMAGNPYTESGSRFQIPDMLSNRADTYNLGDILGGREDAFALSYVENALTSNAVLAPLGGRDPQDLYKLLRIAQGEAIPSNEIAHPYSAGEVAEITAVLRHLLQVQKVLLSVNAEYIRSASQEDNYRTEPPFKLQGSYRNMNKITEKVVAAHTAGEIESLVDDHYTSESQTLTTGAEQNLLKLAELRGRVSEEQNARWTAIKSEFGRQRRMGGKEDDPITRVTGTLSGLGEEIERVRGAILQASERSEATAARSAEHAAQGAEGVAARIAPELTRLGEALQRVARPQLEVAVQVPGPEASADAIATRLRSMGEEVGPMLRATQHGLGTLPGLLQSLVSVLERMDERFAKGMVPIAAVAAPTGALPQQVVPQAMPAMGAPQAPAQGYPQAQAHPQAHPQVHPQAHPQAQIPHPSSPRSAPQAGPSAPATAPTHPRTQGAVPGPGMGAPQGGAGRFPTPLPTPTASMPPAARQRFDVELSRDGAANLYLPAGTDLDVVRDGGVFVPTRKTLPLVGNSVILAVQMVGAPRFETTAVVTWRTEALSDGTPAGFGARFPYLTGAQEALVRRFFAERPAFVLRPPTR